VGRWLLVTQVNDVIFERLGGGEDQAGSLAARLIFFLMSIFGDTTTIGDAGTVAVALAPRLATTRRLHVAMELSGGRTRGIRL